MEHSMIYRREGAEKAGRQNKSSTKAAQTWTNPSPTRTKSSSKSRSSGRSRGRVSQVFSSDDDEQESAPVTSKRTSYSHKSSNTTGYHLHGDSDTSPATGELTDSFRNIFVLFFH